MVKKFEIAVIAHDGKKADMVQFLNKNKHILIEENIKLIATGTTGGKVESVGIKVKKNAFWSTRWRCSNCC